MRCRVRGKLRLRSLETTHPVAVGDEVVIRMVDDGTGTIVDIVDRRSSLVRKAAGRRRGRAHVIAANIDAVWIVQALRKPGYNPGFIDRVLAAAEYAEVEAGLLFNKIDLAESSEEIEMLQHAVETYRSIGYDALLLSAMKGEGVRRFAGCLEGTTSVLVGPSGVGKSTLLNAIQPKLHLKTSTVSEQTKKGRHTTASTSMFALDSGGRVIDTPGVREYGLYGIDAGDLSWCFREFRPYMDACSYADCIHDREPECGVRAAVEAGEIVEERFVSYLNILDSLDAA